VPDADFVYSNFSCKERADRYPKCDPANAEFEQLFDAQKQELDSAKRQAAWNRITELLYQRPIGVYLVQPNVIYVAKNVDGVEARADDIIFFDRIAVK
jgi:ABC-type transport system substrate-binding protein